MNEQLPSVPVPPPPPPNGDNGNDAQREDGVGGNEWDTNSFWVIPVAEDVIFDRKNQHTEHPGNVHFRSVLQHSLELYRASTTRAAKKDLICRIHNDLRDDSSNRRFLQEYHANQSWFVLNEESAKIKIEYALRCQEMADRVHYHHHHNHRPPHHHHRLPEQQEPGDEDDNDADWWNRPFVGFENDELDSLLQDDNDVYGNDDDGDGD
uniref:DUF6824 domain-containing protein n=1 Tax=Amphora coffeiformis TaxID=265554 RepID=A0A7S3LAS8_9STRA